MGYKKMTIENLVRRGIINDRLSIRAIYVDYNFIPTQTSYNSGRTDTGEFWSSQSLISENKALKLDLWQCDSLKRICKRNKNFLDCEVMEFKQDERILYLRSKNGDFPKPKEDEIYG